MEGGFAEIQGFFEEACSFMAEQDDVKTVMVMSHWDVEGDGAAADTSTPGCAADPSVEACVCAQDAYCCNTAWDSVYVDEITQFNCGTCPP